MSSVRCPTGLVILATFALLLTAVADNTFGAHGEQVNDQTFMPAGALYDCVPEPVLTVIVAGAVRKDSTSI